MHLLQSALHVVQVGLGYLLMLVAMTFNGWLFLAVCFGAGVGYLLFAKSRHIFGNVRESNEHCHWRPWCIQRELFENTVYIIFICQKPVIKCERIELVDNGVLHMYLCLGVAWDGSALAWFPVPIPQLCCVVHNLCRLVVQKCNTELGINQSDLKKMRFWRILTIYRVDNWNSLSSNWCLNHVPVWRLYKFGNEPSPAHSWRWEVSSARCWWRSSNWTV